MGDLLEAVDRGRLTAPADYQDFVPVIGRRTDKEAGFKVLPKPWVVESAFGWMTRKRPVVRDCGQPLMNHIALGSLMQRRFQSGFHPEIAAVHRGRWTRRGSTPGADTQETRGRESRCCVIRFSFCR